VITRAEVEHIARLSRLHFDEEELERLQRDLSQILDYVRTLGELDLADVPPTAHAVALKNVLRADEVRPGLGRGEAVAGGPSVERGQFVVPRIG
jgi:aspartyl-tRNA(Asn)/glutamyl-tRNA(Gln) amidotransferase subunit C